MLPDQIELIALKNAVIEGLESLTWQPSGQTQATNYIGGVHGTLVVGGTEDSPWACVLDGPPIITKVSTGRTVYGKRTPIEVWILSDYTNLEEQDAMDRLINAYQATEQLLTSDAFMNTIGAPGWEYVGWEPADNDEMKLMGRKLTLFIKSRI